jgi:SAM-dependent methyltransferase
MLNQIIPSPIQYHNRNQLDYFGQKIKKTMIPVDTYYVNNHVEQLIAFSGISTKDKILEVGCGMGKFTFPLLKRRFKITGLDLSPFLLEQLLRYNDNTFDIPLLACDVLDAPHELDNSFDHVIGFFTLHHFHNLRICFQALARLVKPGGTVCFVEPNAYNPLYYIQIFATPGMNWAGDKGVADMRFSKFEEAANYAGLSNLTIEKYGAFPPFIANTKWGEKTEKHLEKINILNPVLPFQVLKMQKI